MTDIRISLCDQEKLKAFVTITFDDEFVVRGLRIIAGQQGLFVAMPSRVRPDGSHQDVAHPINKPARDRLEETIFTAYHAARSEKPQPEALSPSP